MTKGQRWIFMCWHKLLKQDESWFFSSSALLWVSVLLASSCSSNVCSGELGSSLMTQT